MVRLFGTLALVLSAGVTRTPVRFDAQPAAKVGIVAGYGQLPLHFEPNVGQFDPQVRYVTRGAGHTVFLTDTEAVMVMSRKDLAAVVRMKLVGARQPAQWAGLEKLPGISNYFLGNDPKKWHTDVPNYARVEAKGVYRGINLAYYGNQRKLEYDFIVAPGADPGQVQLAWEGADALRVNEEGDLVITTRLGEMVQKKPLVYQQVGGKQVEVATSYQLLPDQRVKFELASYDRKRELRIDPVVLVYSTYLGGGAAMMITAASQWTGQARPT